MKPKVKKLEESETGLNTKVSINNVPYDNNSAYYMAKAGLVEGYNGSTSSKGAKYIRSNPDKSKNNNIEK